MQDKKDKETNGFKSRMGERAPKPRLLRLKPEDNVLVKAAPLTKGKFTWVTESGRQERWIVASCGNYTVLWNFRCALQSAAFEDPNACALFGPRATVSLGAQGGCVPVFTHLLKCVYACRAVKLATPDVVSYGGLTTVTDYHLIPKKESVVDSVFMHDNFAPSPSRDESAMVVVTNEHVYSLADDE